MVNRTIFIISEPTLSAQPRQQKKGANITQLRTGSYTYHITEAEKGRGIKI